MKKTIRDQVLKRLKTMDQDKKKSKDQAIYENLFASKFFKEAQTLMAYMSFGTEIDTQPIIQRAWKEGKTVAIPYTIKETRLIKPALINSLDDLSPGAYGILGPDEESLKVISKEDLDLVIVPGVAFDKSGYRIGYGGGYYDRFLEKLHVNTLAILYEDQLIERVPREDHDIRVQVLVTEKDLYIS